MENKTPRKRGVFCYSQAFPIYHKVRIWQGFMAVYTSDTYVFRTFNCEA